MLNREDWLMIREMREKGCYLREIAERVGCSERTVRRALKRGGPPPRRRAGVRASKLDPYKAQVDQLLAEGVWNATVIFAEIKARGYAGGISILRDYIRPKRALRKARDVVRFETAPGRQLQSDWGQVETVVGGQVCKVHFAVDAFIDVCGNRYSVPAHLFGETVVVRITLERCRMSRSTSWVSP